MTTLMTHGLLAVALVFTSGVTALLIAGHGLWRTPEDR